MLSWKEKVKDLLTLNDYGLSITDISNKLNTTRHTISLALAELKGEGKIKIRMVGVAKLHYLIGN